MADLNLTAPVPALILAGQVFDWDDLHRFSASWSPAQLDVALSDPSRGTPPRVVVVDGPSGMVLEMDPADAARLGYRLMTCAAAAGYDLDNLPDPIEAEWQTADDEAYSAGWEAAQAVADEDAGAVSAEAIERYALHDGHDPEAYAEGWHAYLGGDSAAEDAEVPRG